MITIFDIWHKVCIFLGIRRDFNDRKIAEETKYVRDYRTKNKENITWETSNKLANIITMESTVSLTYQELENDRVTLIDEQLQKMWDKIKKITSRMLGEAEVIAIPYVDPYGKMKVNYINKTRVRMLHDDGENPVDIAIIADKKIINEKVYQKIYRMSLLPDGTHTTTTFFNNNGDMSNTPFDKTGWKPEKPRTISNCDRLLIARFVCPVDSRHDDVMSSANITDGVQDLINEYIETINYIEQEYNLKKYFIGASSDVLKKDKNGNIKGIIKQGVFKIFDGEKINDLIQGLDSEIRADACFAKLANISERIERRMGVSRGILTNIDDLSSYTNQANIKRQVLDTYALTTQARKNIEKGTKDFIYACNVLAEVYGLAGSGYKFENYILNFSWSNALIEVPSEEFTQILELHSAGAKSKAELLAWFDNTTVDEAQEKIDRMPKNESLVNFL